MKNFFFFGIFSLSMGSLFAQISQNGLIFHCSFDGSLGDNSSNNTTTTQNNVTFTTDRDGMQNNAGAFNGSSSRLIINNNNPIITTSNFSIASWAYMNGPGGGAQSQNTIFQQRGNSVESDSRSVILLIPRHNNGNSMFLLRSSINDGGQTVEAVKAAPSYNSWNHFVGVKCDNEVKLYINGVLENTSIYNQTGDFVSSIDFVSIGNHSYNSNDFQGAFNGKIDDFRIYNRCLSDEDVQNIYNNRFTETVDLEWGQQPVVYPNPSSGRIMFYSEDFQVERVKILDLNGKLIEELDVDSDHSIFLNHVTGTYLLKIVCTDKKEFTTRLVIQ